MSPRAKAVEIVPYSDSLRAQTISFFERVSPDHPELARGELLDWQRSQRFLALFQNRIVGHIARIPQKFTRNGDEVNLGWAATLVLDTELPLVQTFAGTSLLDQLTNDTGFRFAAVGVVPAIEQTHRRRGYVVNRSAVKMYARFLHPAAMLRYMARSSLFGPPIAAINLIYRAASPRDNTQIRSITQFESSWDSTWLALLEAPGRLFGLHTADYLNYKLSQPHKEYQVLLHGALGREPDGYAVFRSAVNDVKKLKLLKLVDLVGTEEAKAALLARAISVAKSTGVDGVVALDSSTESASYSKAGLWVNRAFPVVVPPDLDGEMRVTFLDSDLDDLW